MTPHATGSTALPLVSRLTHWTNAFAIVCMIGSGWCIYNASPFLPFVFPAWLTIGGWLGGALAIHFAMMWLLGAGTLLYFAHGLIGGGLRRRMLPLSPREVARDLRLALTFRLKHDTSIYNAVQRLMYVGVLAVVLLMIASGLALWKPVQLGWLTALMGGYEAARRVHFLGMAGIVGFLLIHLALVAIVPRTLLTMLLGQRRMKGIP
jgi:thiosulfate reductase cytochrome b subunit